MTKRKPAVDDETLEKLAIGAVTVSGAINGFMLGTMINNAIDMIENYEPWWKTVINVAQDKREDLQENVSGFFNIERTGTEPPGVGAPRLTGSRIKELFGIGE